jgi:hypothetical protein
MRRQKVLLTQAQVRALCEGAKNAGYVPVVKMGDLTILLVPEGQAAAYLTGEPWNAAHEVFDAADVL